MQSNVIQYPSGQPIQMQQIDPATGMLLPAFPMLAQRVDEVAVRIPWYVWLGLGAFLMFKLAKR